MHIIMCVCDTLENYIETHLCSTLIQGGADIYVRGIIAYYMGIITKESVHGV